MARSAVISIIGEDRPGIVDEVSRFVFERGGNLEDSRMADLGGQFAMMALVSGDDVVLDRLSTDLGELQTTSRLHAEIVAAGRTRRRTDAMPFHLSAKAMDQPGLVQAIAHLPAGVDVNIESAETRLRQAPFTGAPVFDMEMDVAVPRSTRIATLRESLESLCREHDIDWRLTAL